MAPFTILLHITETCRLCVSFDERKSKIKTYNQQEQKKKQLKKMKTKKS